MRCPSCGEFNEADFAFCRNCGRALNPAEEGEAATIALEPSQRPVQVPQQPEAEPVPVPPAARPAFKLVSSSGLLSGRTFTIGPKGLIIGRDPTNCQVVIADDEVSRQHAWIGYNDREEVILQDRKSANGTYVNQKRIKEQVLKPADTISFGTGNRNAFRIEPMAVAASPPAPVATPAKAVNARGAEGGSATSVLSAADLMAAAQEEKSAGGTVKIRLTDLMARPHVELIVDKYAVKTLDIPDEGLKVGRDAAQCALVMEHPSVSGVHAEIKPADGKMTLTDRSTNGTFVNGLRVKGVELRDGDYITFGRYAGKSLIFRTGLEPELKVETIALNKDHLTIGRDASNDVCINHPTVSKNHAEILKQDGRVWLADRGSTNGTFVNGIKIKRHQLQELDRIVIGPAELRFTGEGLARAGDTAVVRLDIRGVSFQVPDRSTGQPKLLLDDISLVVRPRELIGFLGPSGAGKTTLMNVLNGFGRPTSGQVLYNGAELYHNLGRLKSTIGFVPQEDIMHRQLSVRRCLYYAARLRLPDDLSDQEINRRIEEMLEILKIDPQRWNNPVSTLSGGQRKRVSIGIELLSKPGVLFLDEPTAGLDPRTETLMMMLFRQLANQGSTIVITTHLLASFGVLDKVVVLVQGRLAFYGPGTKFLDYFKAQVPPDVYDDLTDNNNISYAQELKKRYVGSPLYKELIAEPLGAAQPAASLAPAAAQAPARRFGLRQFKTLVARNWELKFGDRAQTALLFLQAPLVALLVGFMASESNQVQTIFMAMFAALWFGCSNAVREIVDEGSIYRRERQTGLKVPSYVFSKLFVLSVVALVQCASVVVILLFVHHALALYPTEVLGAIGIMFLVAVNGTLIGLVISAVVRTPEKALTLFPLVLIPELLLSGLFMPVRPIRTLIPVTVEQLMEGKMYAQPEAKAKARKMMHPSGNASAPAAPNAGEEAAMQGEFGHQVAGAVEPSAKVQEAFHRYTPAPVEGMPAGVRWLSALAVSRWGLEALSDLCIHGAHSTEDSSYKIINTVYISLHPDEVNRLAAALEAPAGAFSAPGSFPLPADFWKDEGPYLAVLAAFALIMTALVLALMKRKDVA